MRYYVNTTAYPDRSGVYFVSDDVLGAIARAREAANDLLEHRRRTHVEIRITRPCVQCAGAGRTGTIAYVAEPGLICRACGGSGDASLVASEIIRSGRSKHLALVPPPLPAIVDVRVKIIGPHLTDVAGRSLCGREGVVTEVSGNHVGVRIDGHQHAFLLHQTSVEVIQ